MRFQTLATTATLFTVIGANVIRHRSVADGAKVTLISKGEDCKLKVEGLQGCHGTSDPVGKVQDNRCIGKRNPNLHTVGEGQIVDFFFLLGGEATPIKVCNGVIDIHYDESPNKESHEVVLDGDTDWIPGDVFYHLNGTRGYVHVGIGIDCSNTYHSKGLWGGGCM
ncbi:hypothetical protein N7492_006696 [Penicillium capsulatum]|uniref:Uncharacterized protein n=1 Tax=Penicillium capsulatum TaxID=69766 RepID=A0A9W9HZU5_9EURO|nr:hypothetical protein N7492_006696 [Penicillium capsulatum]KAJ6116532.1 hypothetical protein N7512_006257 [Penicillium capsulatum]